MRLVEAGELGLDDEITRFLPDFPTQGHTVRIHHLLNHTSGIQSYTGLDEFWARSRLDLSHEDLIGLIADEPFDFAPGTGYAYNNSGYYLLGMIIEEITGETYADHLRETIFEPLGLEATYYCSNEPIIRHRAAGYARLEGELVNAAMLSMTSPFAAGALCSTVVDLVSWQGALRDNRLIDAATFERMITPETLEDGSPLTYGYGLSVGELGGHEKISHGGGINGFNTALAYYPGDDLTIVVLANTEGANPGSLERRIARAVLGVPEPVVADLPIPREELARSVGDYFLDELHIRVFEDDGQLMLQVGDDDPFRLLYQGEHAYVASFDLEMGVTFAAGGGVASQLVISQEGSEFLALRPE
jgi:CubicO group peptidase (beta-lactamase class C family)